MKGGDKICAKYTLKMYPTKFKRTILSYAFLMTQIDSIKCLIALNHLGLENL